MGRRNYSEEEIERGLLSLALFGGRATAASLALKEEGHPAIPPATLRSWKERHAQRFEEISTERYREVQARVASDGEAIAVRAMKLSEKLLQHIEEHYEDMKPDAAAGAVRNVMTTAGISIDKARVIRDLPTEISEHRSLDEIKRRWLARGLIVDGSMAEKDLPALPEAA